ncbi:MAG: SDR family oxidoreductase [Bacteroidota bacterium]
MIVAVTGASQGIGAAIAEAFAAEHGAQIALLARSRAKLEAVAARCRMRGAEAEAFVCDVTDGVAVAAVAKAVRARFGTADVLVNNAGQFQPGALLDTDAAAFRQQVEVNLTSAFLVTHAFLPSMVERRRGHLFFMASVASLQAYPGGAAYCAAKHGLLGLARVVREETKPLGLRVTTLLPGATLTPSWDGTDLPPDRLMPPEDIAHAVVDAWRLSDRTVVEELVLRPQLGDL